MCVKVVKPAFSRLIDGQEYMVEFPLLYSRLLYPLK